MDEWMDSFLIIADCYDKIYFKKNLGSIEMKNKFSKDPKIRTAILHRGMIFLIICCITLTGCDPLPYYFARNDLVDIVSIELIQYDNPEQKEFFSWVPDHMSDLKPFDNSKVNILETLDEGHISELIDTLCESHILDTYYAYDSPNGLCLRLTYSSGDFLIVSCDENSYTGYIGKFSPDGEVAQFIGCFESSRSFKNLVNDYFQMKI